MRNKRSKYASCDFCGSIYTVKEAETLNAEKEAAASDYQKLQELAEQEAEYTAEYDALMEKWEVLSEAIAAEEG